MWLINELKNELCPDMSYEDIVDLAKNSNFDETVDANDEVFFSPVSMKSAFDKKTSSNLDTYDDYFRCAYRSLALCYKNAIEELERNTKKEYKKIYIVGGGAKNEYLNSLTKEYTNKEIIALPIEATALGNLKVQMEV